MTASEVLSILHAVNLDGKLFRNHVQMNCPFAKVSHLPHGYDKDMKFGITAKAPDVVWNCFSCSRNGVGLRSLLTQLELVMDIPTKHVRERLKKYENYATLAAIGEMPDYDTLFARKDAPVATFPEALLAPFVGTVPKYILSRGIALETCRTWELGFDRKQHRVTFPVREKDKKQLVGMVGRYIGNAPVQIPRYLNYWDKLHKKCGQPLNLRGDSCFNCMQPVLQEEGFDPGFMRSNFLFGEHLFPQGYTAVFVEGPIDALKVYQAVKGKKYFPLAGFGSKWSPKQMDRALSISGDRAVFLFDPDESGMRGMRKVAQHLRRRMTLLKAAKVASDAEKLPDPGDMDEKDILQSIKGAELFI